MIIVTENVTSFGAYVLRARGEEFSSLAEIEAAFPGELIEFHRNLDLERRERKRLAPKFAVDRDAWLSDF